MNNQTMDTVVNLHADSDLERNMPTKPHQGDMENDTLTVNSDSEEYGNKNWKDDDTGNMNHQHPLYYIRNRPRLVNWVKYIFSWPLNCVFMMMGLSSLAMFLLGMLVGMYG